jgi:hypothetical protein
VSEGESRPIGVGAQPPGSDATPSGGDAPADVRNDLDLERAETEMGLGSEDGEPTP